MGNYSAPSLGNDSNPNVSVGKVGVVTLAFLAIVTFWESGGRTILTPYYDDVGVLTVCDGITNMGYPGFVVKGQTYTQKQCDDAKAYLFRTQVFPQVTAGLKHPVTNRQYLMLADFVWGVGPKPYWKSTLLKQVNAGNCLDAGKEFEKWNHAGGKVLGGLTRRSKWHGSEWIKDCLNPIWEPH